MSLVAAIVYVTVSTTTVPTTEVEGSWSLGAGFTTSGFALGTGALLALPPPGASLTLEYALSPSIRLLMNANGSYQELDQDVVGPKSVSRRVAAGAGVRWVVNPGDLVEFSPYGILGGSWQKLTSDEPLQNDYTGASVEGGFVVEYRLLEQLYARLQTALVNATYVTGTIENSATESDLSSLSISAAIRPGLELRFLF